MGVNGMAEDVLLSTTENIPGYRIVKVVGIARGGVVRAKHVGKDILAAFKNITGGEIKEYTELLAEARETAIKRLKEDARRKGANAVIGLRFMTSAIASGAAEIFAYGTAVVVEPE